MTYDEFINNIIISRGRFFEGGHKERHHIIPRCIGGTNDDENLIDLTLEEHFMAHKLLAEENPDSWELENALHFMMYINRTRSITSINTPEEYSAAKEEIAEQKQKCYYRNGLPEYVKQKISKSNTGKKRTPEMKEASRKRLKEYYATHPAPFTGKKLSEQHREALRQGHKHRDRSTYKGGAKTPEAKATAIEKFKKTYWSTPEEIRQERIKKQIANRKPTKYWQGKTIPQEMRDKISETLKQKHLAPPHSVKIYCAETDTTYRSLTEAQDALGIDRHIIKRYIEGKRKDGKWHFEYAKERETYDSYHSPGREEAA